MEDTGFTLEGRVLCGDDACIGTIGPDRRCKLCGRPYDGDAEVGTGAPDTGTDKGVEAPRRDANASSEETATADAQSGGERTCCADDACVGIIGPDGLCGVCRKSAS